MNPTPAVIAYLDHIVVACPDTAGVDRYFALMHDHWQLPVAWPCADLGGYYTAGIWAGNMAIELGYHPARPARAATGYIGLVFAPPSIESALAELDRRGIAHTPPHPFTGQAPDGATGLLWITAGLPAFAAGETFVVLCDYQPIMAIPAGMRRMSRELRDSQGGPLGLQEVREVVVGVPDLAAALPAWDAVFAPLPRWSGDRWVPASGPAVRLVPAATYGIQAMVWQVGNLSQARSRLPGLPAGGAYGPDDPATTSYVAQVGDLPIRLVRGPGVTQD